jgi:hypothetical protein
MVRLIVGGKEEDVREKDQGPDWIGALGMNDECTWGKINAGGCRWGGMSYRLRHARCHRCCHANRRRNFRVERYCLEARSASAHCAERGLVGRRDIRPVHLDKDRAKLLDSHHARHSDKRRAVARWAYSC